MLIAEYEIRIACYLRGPSNNTFSADHRKIAAKSSHPILSYPQTNIFADYQYTNETLKNEYKNTNH
jgi:hypothetical protein